MKRSSDTAFNNPPAKKTSATETASILEQGRIYFSPIGGITVPRAESVNSLSLAEVIEHIKPINSLHLSFVLDFKFLYSCYPMSHRDMPMTLVVGERDAKSLEQETASYSNVKVLGASISDPFGVHHTKLSILESADGKVHVLIYTGNFTTEEWEFRTQQFYYAYGTKTETEAKRSEFQEGLIIYFNQYRFLLRQWALFFYKVDFSEVKDRLIYSAPGEFTHVAAEILGHPLLKKALAEKFPKVAGEKLQESPSYIAQCSSIGSLGHPNSWLRGEFLQSLEGGNLPDKDSPQSNIRLIFPCIDDIRKSCRGYISGTSFPYKMCIHRRQQWLGKMMFKWRANHCRRTLAMPHCKTYVKYYQKLPQWQLMTSANLSKAAWGEYRDKGQTLYIRSYEMGVLITDPLRFNIPFDYPLVSYSSTDDPFTTDTKHLEKDIFDQIYNPFPNSRF